MSHIDDLKKVVRDLEEGYDLVKARLERNVPGVNPLVVTDTNGNFILLNSLTEIVRARSVLAQLESN